MPGFKTDWKDGDIVHASDMNRIETNIRNGDSEWDSEEQYNIGDYVKWDGGIYYCRQNGVIGKQPSYATFKYWKPFSLYKDIEIFISPDGSDDTGDGTESNPYATYQTAINSLPKAKSPLIEVNVLDGFGVNAKLIGATGVYEEDIELNDFDYPILFTDLKIDGTKLNYTPTIRSIRVRNCRFVGVYYLNLKGGIDTVGKNFCLKSSYNSYVRCYGVKCIPDTPDLYYGFYEDYGGTFEVTNGCSTSNCLAAARIMDSSVATFVGLSGTGNTYRFRSAYGGIIFHSSSTVESVNGDFKMNGLILDDIDTNALGNTFISDAEVE